MQRSFLLLVLVALLSAAAGGAFGLRYGRAHPQAAQDMHVLLHRGLDLTPEQNHQMEALEQDFAAKRVALDAEMRAADHDLAAAIRKDHQYGPAVQAAVMRLHQAMAELQELTVRHMLAMRALLTPVQAAKLDHAIDHALTGNQ